MYCPKCGSELSNGSKFCSKCGTAVLSTNISEKLKKNTLITTSASVPNQNNKNHKVCMIVIIVVALMIIILGVVLFGGRSYKATIKKWVYATMNGDAEVIFELMPEKMVDYVLEQNGYDSNNLDEWIDGWNQKVEFLSNAMAGYVGSVKISYEILDIEDIKGDDLDEIKDSYKEADVKVSAAKVVEVEITAKTDETEKSSSQDYTLIKVGRSWYFDFMDELNNMLSLY